MRVVGIKLLKNKLSEYVRLAAEGETVLITDRDKVVAELRAPQGRSPQVADAVLLEAIRRGLFTPPAEPAARLAPLRGPRVDFDQVLRGLDADRSDR